MSSGSIKRRLTQREARAWRGPEREPLEAARREDQHRILTIFYGEVAQIRPLHDGRQLLALLKRYATTETSPLPPYWWRRERRHESLARANHARCCCCEQVGSAGHHIIGLDNGGDSTEPNIVTICADCHGEVHPHLAGKTERGRRRMFAVAQDNPLPSGLNPYLDVLLAFCWELWLSAERQPFHLAGKHVEALLSQEEGWGGMALKALCRANWLVLQERSHYMEPNSYSFNEDGGYRVQVIERAIAATHVDERELERAAVALGLAPDGA